MVGDGWTLQDIEKLKAPINGAIAIGPFGSRMKSDCYVPSGVPVIRGNNISDTRELVGEMVHISPELADQLGNAIVHADDLVFPHRGSIGQVGIVPRNSIERYALSSSLMKLTCDRRQVEPLFLFYFFRSSDGQHELLKNASTVGTPGIGQPLSSLRSIKVPIPSLSEQKAIAYILGMLDDKIELNRRMNATLEAMAQALFKSWFVDFDPVKAKAAGRAPEGMDADTAALFPSEFQDSELGPIPKEWGVGTIDAATSLIIDHRGKTPKKLGTDWAVSGIPAISAKNIKAGRMVQKESMNLVDQKLYDRWMKDKLAVGDTLMTSEAPLGELLYLACNTELCLSQRVFALRANQEKCLPAYLYFWLGSTETQSRMSGRATGTTVVGIRQTELRKVEVLLPSRKVQEKANEFLHGCLTKIEANEKESELLASIRDALLPKLISGQLRIPAGGG